MKLRKISEETQKVYENRKRMTSIFMIVPAGIALIIIALILLSVIQGAATILIYIAIGLLIFSLRYIVYMRTLRRLNYLFFKAPNVSEFVDISQDGISADIITENGVDVKLFSWDELTEMKGFYADFSMNRNGADKYRMAFIGNGSEDDSQQNGITVEMYDDMIFEIKKHWKKDKT